MPKAPEITVVLGGPASLSQLYRAIGSVTYQSMPLGSIDMVLVLDRRADQEHSELRLLAQKLANLTLARCGPGEHWCQVGLQAARGRYVYFLPGDAYLGDEAVELMVTLADASGADITHGCAVRSDWAFDGLPLRGNQARADVFAPRLYGQLEPWKLFRRSFLADRAPAFDGRLELGAERAFMSRAFLSADVVSVRADYECCYLPPGPAPAITPEQARPWLIYLRTVLAGITELLPVSDHRDRLVSWHLHEEFSRCLDALRDLPASPDREISRSLAQQLLRKHYTDRVRTALPATTRLAFGRVLRGQFPDGPRHLDSPQY